MANIYTKLTKNKIIQFEDVSQKIEEFNYEKNGIIKPLTYSGATSWVEMQELGVFFDGSTYGRSDDFGSSQLLLRMSDEELLEILEENEQAEVGSIINLNFSNAKMSTDSQRDASYIDKVREELLRVSKPQIKIIDIKDKTTQNLQKNDDFIDKLKSYLDERGYYYRIELSYNYMSELNLLDNDKYISENIGNNTYIEPEIIDSHITTSNIENSQLFYYTFKLKYDENSIPDVLKEHFSDLLPIVQVKDLLVLELNESNLDTKDERLIELASHQLRDSPLQEQVKQVNRQVNDVFRKKIDELIESNQQKFIQHIKDTISPYSIDYDLSVDKPILFSDGFHQTFILRCKLPSFEINDKVRLKVVNISGNVLSIKIKFSKTANNSGYSMNVTENGGGFISYDPSSIFYIYIKANHDLVKRISCETILSNSGKNIEYAERLYLTPFDANDRRIAIDDDALYSEMKEYAISVIQQDVKPVTDKIAKIKDAYKALNDSKSNFKL